MITINGIEMDDGVDEPDWISTPQRTETFQKWLNSLEERSVKRIRPTLDKRSYNEQERSSK